MPGLNLSPNRKEIILGLYFLISIIYGPTINFLAITNIYRELTSSIKI